MYVLGFKILKYVRVRFQNFEILKYVRVRFQNFEILKYVRVRFQNFEIFMKKLKFLENRFFLPFFIGKHPHKLVRTILEYSLGRILVTIRPKTDDLGLTYSILKILTFLILEILAFLANFQKN